jgi:SRSO17 transposase
VRRQIDDPEELSAYVVFAPEQTSLEQLARVAGSRWQVEVAFEATKSEVGLDHYEVRSWGGWYRHITLSLFAHALLSAIRATGQDIQMPTTTTKKGELFGQQAAASSSLAAFKRGRGL